jgi:Zn finger protein HypA/HybF involved in hydrogenase expression
MVVKEVKCKGCNKLFPKDDYWNGYCIQCESERQGIVMKCKLGGNQIRRIVMK